MLRFKKRGFGEASPQKHPQSRSLGFLFRFFMQSMLIAAGAEFFKFQPVLESLLIFVRKIIDGLAFSAFQLDHVVLAHKYV